MRRLLVFLPFLFATVASAQVIPEMGTVAKAQGQSAAGAAGAESGLCTNLTAWWDFESDATDSHDSGPYNLTTVGSPTYTTGKNGNGATTFSTSNYFSIAAGSASAFRPLDTDFSIALWAKFNTVAAAAQFIVSMNTTTGNNAYKLGIYDGDDVFWSVSSNGSSFSALKSFNLATDTWYAIVGTHDATNDELTLYLNTETPVTTAHSGGAYNATSTPFTIGASGLPGGPVDGVLDNVAYWSEELSAADVSAYYNGGSGLSYSALNCGAPSGPDAPSTPSIASSTPGDQEMAIVITPGGGGGPVSDYYILYDTSTIPDNAPFTGVDSVSTGGSTSKTVASLTNDVLYYFRVRATGGGGVSALSTEDSDTPTSGGGTATYTVANYTALRAQACTNGETAEVTGTNVGGFFVCDSTPLQTADDGGLYIDSPDADQWVRLFPASTTGEPDNPKGSQPINLNWWVTGGGHSTTKPYVIASAGDITNLFDYLAGHYRDTNDSDSDGYLDLFLRGPGAASTTRLNFQNMTGGAGGYTISGATNHGPVDSLFWLEDLQNVNTVKLVDSPRGSAFGNKHAWFLFNRDYSNIVLGTQDRIRATTAHRLTFDGNFNQAPEQELNTGSEQKGLFNVWGTSNVTDRAVRLEIRANINWALSWGVRSQNCPGWYGGCPASGASATPDSVLLSGEWIQGQYWSQAEMVLLYDSLYMSDPWGKTMGYCNGRSTALCDQAAWNGDFPTYGDGHKGQAAPAMPHSGLNNGKKVVGYVTTQFGNHNFGGRVGPEYIGNGPDDPFVWVMKDLHRIGVTNAVDPAGTRVCTGGSFLQEMIKWDALGDDGPNKKWFKMVNGPNDYGQWPVAEDVCPRGPIHFPRHVSGGDPPGEWSNETAYMTHIYEVATPGEYFTGDWNNGVGGDTGIYSSTVYIRNMVWQGTKDYSNKLHQDPYGIDDAFVNLAENDTIRWGWFNTIHISQNDDWNRAVADTGQDPHDTVVDSVKFSRVLVCVPSGRARSATHHDCPNGGGSTATNISSGTTVGGIVKAASNHAALDGDIVIRDSWSDGKYTTPIQIADGATVSACRIQLQNGNTISVVDAGSSLAVWNGSSWADVDGMTWTWDSTVETVPIDASGWSPACPT